MKQNQLKRSAPLIVIIIFFLFIIIGSNINSLKDLNAGTVDYSGVCDIENINGKNGIVMHKLNFAKENTSRSLYITNEVYENLIRNKPCYLVDKIYFLSNSNLFLK